MPLTQQEALLILSNLDGFVARYELATKKTMTPGALKIVQEVLTHASFPEGCCSPLLN